METQSRKSAVLTSDASRNVADFVSVIRRFAAENPQGLKGAELRVVEGLPSESCSFDPNVFIECFEKLGLDSGISRQVKVSLRGRNTYRITKRNVTDEDPLHGLNRELKHFLVESPNFEAHTTISFSNEEEHYLSKTSPDGKVMFSTESVKLQKDSEREKHKIILEMAVFSNE